MEKSIRRFYIEYACKEFPYHTITGIKELVRKWESVYYGINSPIAWEYTKNHRPLVKRG